jgi:3-oxoacyl-[acyl-carrier-protein] synthase II
LDRRVVVTGMGMISPLGNSVPETWENVVAGRSGISPLTRFSLSPDLPPTLGVAAEVKGFTLNGVLDRKEARRVDLFIQYALVAADEALRSAEAGGLGRPVPNPEETGVIIGSGIGGIPWIVDTVELMAARGPTRVSPFFVTGSIINLAGGQIAMRTGATGPNFATVSACATSNHAIGEGYHIIRRGDADMMIVGGAEAALTPISFAAYHAARALATEYETLEAASLPFDRRRRGFVHGEGAAVLVIEALDSARARGAPILAEVIGFGMSSDAHHVTAPPEDGAGAVRAMSRGLRSAGLQPREVDYINAHATGTPVGDIAEARAVHTVFGEAAEHVPISSTKSMLGHALGATAAIEAVLCVQALRDGVMPPTINLTDPDPLCDLNHVALEARAADLHVVMSNSFGFGGANTSLLLRRWEESEG